MIIFSKTLRRSFFGFLNKNKPAVADKEKTSLEDFNNLGHVVEKLKKDNQSRSFLLPPKLQEDEKKLTVAIELDETFCSTFCPDEHEAYLFAPRRKYDKYVEIKEYDNYLNIYLRDKYEPFFAYLQKYTEAVIFSKGEQVYVDKVLDIFDEKREIFKHRLYQKECNFIDLPTEDIQEFVKDLGLLGRDLKRTVYIDCDPMSFWTHPNNGILLEPFVPDKVGDLELERMIDFLEVLKDEEDVRMELNLKFGIEQILRETKLL